MSEQPELKKLNLGCGFKKRDDYWNVDVEPKCRPDQVVNLEQTPWPWEDNFFTHIDMDNILEHLGQTPAKFTDIMKELYRVSADKAEWVICVPHHRCDLFWDDYTHVRVLTAKTFRMFDQEVNVESIKRKLSDSTFGLYHDIDIEVTDVTYNIVSYWRDQLEKGFISQFQFDMKMNTISNVAESINIFITVHKPGRQANYLKVN